MLKDSFGRILDYLRVSVTDRCNLRCVYCMPPEGVEWRPHDSILSFEEILRFSRIMAELGIRNIKVTGGEPLVRRGIAGFIKTLKRLKGIEKVTLTTNGSLLGEYLDEAEGFGSEALPDGINISLDALDKERFIKITRYTESGPEKILPLIDRLLEKNIPVKINCVPVRGLNEEEIIPLAALAKDKDVAVRFIELMPLGSAATMKPVPGAEIAALLEKKFGKLTPFSGGTTTQSDSGVLGSGPAMYYRLPDFTGKIGFINALSRGFCETCNRLRLTSEGSLKPCLSDKRSFDLRELLRAGASDGELKQVITEIAEKKPQYHSFSPDHSKVAGRGSDGMFGIGG